MKNFLWGVLLIILVGFGGFFYRNAIEHPLQPIACPMDAKLCPDGTAVGRVGNSCIFPVCPPPNVTLTNLGISFAIPDGFVESVNRDITSVVTYDAPIASSTEVSSIVIHRYEIAASSTALSTIHDTAIGGASGLPAPTTAFTSSIFGTHRFTVVSLERFEGVIDTAYYLARENDVLRFDAIDRGTDWTNPSLNVSTLPAHRALEKMLTTVSGG